MTSNRTVQTVEGEPLDLLAQAFLQFDIQEEPDGMWSLTSHLEPGIGDPFVRALMRVEARLMLEDADLLGSPEFEHRTYEQRAADALVILATSVGDRARRGSSRTRLQ